ncbi:PhoX family protein [Peribacillus butanolivorans]|uniref:PhoX family protein n=1 Tax=Peribacillus butanolivorans TaxID=421767 RepID=UPI00366EF22E
MGKMNRRRFLGYLGTGTAALTAASTGLGSLTSSVEAATTADHLFGHEKVKKTKKTVAFFKPIKHTSKDELVLPKGFKYNVIAAYGDVINKQGDTFGFNNDFTQFFPIDGSSKRGLLWINHEYSSELFVHGKKQADGKYSAKQIETMLYNMGGSIIEVYSKDGSWKMDTNSKYARRITGLTPFKLTGPASGMASTVQGTYRNCSGGKTLWNTVLSCEENFEYEVDDAYLIPEHYGWVIEVDPFDPTFAVRKHTALGRFNHENTCMGLSKNGNVVIYMGDDKKDACIYKFISKGTYNKSAGKGNSKLLEEGTLYAANMKTGVWVALTLTAVQKALNEEKFKVPFGVNATKDELLSIFKTQADVMINAHFAALILGATPTDRPEDLEIHPVDNTIFIAHTNNDVHGNIHGHITRFFEKDGDLGATQFDFEIFAAGGRQSGFSAPDNLTFDSNGNLWTVTDVSTSSLNKGVHAFFGNNGMYVIPTSGPNIGEAFQFASAPVEAELTGPCFTPDERTLFLSIQHPGELTVDKSSPTSMWPHRKGDTIPRPAVVAITGFEF